MAGNGRRISFDKYIDNPSGGSAFTNRGMYKDMYKRKFNTVLLREQGKINYKIFKDNDPADSYYIYLKIPSEVIENFYYDVVVRLFTTLSSKKSATSLRDYEVQFYSNDPAFVYTFAHSFFKHKLFIPDMESKMSRAALSRVASERNPKDDVWYVKSLFFAYLAMEKYNLFNRIILDRASAKYSKRTLVGLIEHADKKVKARQEAQEKLDAEKRREKAKQIAPRNTGVMANMTRHSNSSNSIKTTRTVSTTKATKRTRTTSMRKKS